MQPAIWSSYFMELSPEEMVDAFVGAGWPTSELSDEHAKVLLDRGDAESEGRRFKAVADERGMSFPQGHLWLHCDICADDQHSVVDDLRGWIDLFAAIGARKAVLHPGGGGMIKAGASPEALLERRVAGFRPVCEHAAERGVTICLENVPKVPHAEELLEIINAVGAANLAICLDTGHLNMIDGDQGAFIRKVGDGLQALHIADNEGKTDQHMMPWGRGNVDWGDVMSALREMGYDGLLNFEIPGERRAPMEIKLAKLDYLKHVVAQMLGLEEAGR